MPVQDIDFDLELKKLKTEYALNKELAVTKALYSSDIAIMDRIPTAEYISGKRLVKDEDPLLMIQKESTDQRITNSLVNTIESYRKSVEDREIVPFIKDEQTPKDGDPKPSNADIVKMLREYGFSSTDMDNMQLIYSWYRPRKKETIVFPNVVNLLELDLDELEYYNNESKGYKQHLVNNGDIAGAASLERYVNIIKKLISSKKNIDFGTSKTHAKMMRYIELNTKSNPIVEEPSEDITNRALVDSELLAWADNKAPENDEFKSTLTRSQSVILPSTSKGKSPKKGKAPLKKSAPKKGSGLYISIPDMVDRLRVLLGEFKSGNKSKKIINESNEILLYLLKMKKINKTEYKKTLKEFNIRV